MAASLDSESSIIETPDHMNVPWSVHRCLVDPKYFEAILPGLEKLCESYQTTVWGKSHESKRISCIFTKDSDPTSNKEKYYKGTIPNYNIDSENTPKELKGIWSQLEKKFGYKFDYMLAHIYRDHNDYLGWHSDKEALDTPVLSVSLGAERSFRFRLVGTTKGYTNEYSLDSGDVLHMHAPDPKSEDDILKKGCQRTYQHYVPPMSVNEIKTHLIKLGITFPSGRFTKNVAEQLMKKHNAYPVRINLTLRQFE